MLDLNVHVFHFLFPYPYPKVALEVNPVHRIFSRMTLCLRCVMNDDILHSNRAVSHRSFGR